MANSYRFYENKECQYYPCHKGVEKFNCLFCYCPLYHIQDCPGKPEYVKYGEDTIKVCTGCTFPHKPDNYDTIIEYLSRK